MLRVGLWHNIEDPAGHEVRHVVLANLSDFGVMKHCQECCNMADQLHEKKVAKEYKEALDRM